MSDPKAEQDMRAAFEVVYPSIWPCISGTKLLAWAAFRSGAQYERDRPQSPTANPGVETDGPDAKRRQGAGE